MKAAVLTISDKGYAKTREDTSGPLLREMLGKIDISVDCYDIVPDERELIVAKLLHYADERKLDLVLTTGGTGVSPRDITPDATKEVIDKEIPGMAEAMRIESFKITPHAVISRAMAGIRGTTLIVNLPGSPKAARENLETILKAIPHTISKIQGDPTECAT